MSTSLSQFESIVRRAFKSTDATSGKKGTVHPFDARNVHENLPTATRELFDNGHFSQATYEAFKFVDKEVQRIAKSSAAGTKLMMSVFGGEHPPVKISSISTQSEKDEQEGYKFLFAGSILAIRNPRGHDYDVVDDIGTCLDHLGLASTLLRKLEDAGYKLSTPS